MNTDDKIRNLENQIREIQFILARKIGGGSADIKANIVSPSSIATTGTIPSGSITNGMLTGNITSSKLLLFISTEQTGTGSAQNIAHGLGATPTYVFVSPTDTSPATTGQFTITEGTHTSTNVVITCTSGKKYKVLAII